MGLDLAPRKCGWCAGDGGSIPVVGGFRIMADMEDLAGVMEETRANVMVLLQRFRPSVVLYESPILPNNRWKGAGGPVIGSLAQRRAQYAQGGMVEWLCSTITEWPVDCREEDLWAIKDALTGNKQATKDDMVAMALKLGVALPEQLVDGREDAADAFGAWLLLLRYFDRARSAEWDRRIHSSKGSLI